MRRRIIEIIMVILFIITVGCMKKETAMYTVTFDSNGGSAVAAVTDIREKCRIPAPAETTRAGFTFEGWYKDRDLNAKWDFDREMVIEDTVLYARWKANTYTITFNSNGGSAIAAITGVFYDKLVMEPSKPTKDNNTFINWYKDMKCIDVWDFANDRITQDTVLYAKWSLKAPEGFVFVKKGEFVMGALPFETPTHQAIFTYNFYISKYETTQKEYTQVTGKANPGIGYGTGDNYPVYFVSWWDSIHYCNKLSEKMGVPKAYNEKTGELLDINGEVTWDITQVRGYRLPTEAEWEYVAKGGREAHLPYKTYSGSDNMDDVAWYTSNAAGVTEVGKKAPNELGVYDMSGNLIEWCFDKLDKYLETPQIDTIGSRNGWTRILRGGSWIDTPICLKSGYREGYDSDYAGRSIGFRVVINE